VLGVRLRRDHRLEIRDCARSLAGAMLEAGLREVQAIPDLVRRELHRALQMAHRLVPVDPTGEQRNARRDGVEPPEQAMRPGALVRLVEHDREQSVLADPLGDALAHGRQRALGLAPETPVNGSPEMDGGAQGAILDPLRRSRGIPFVPGRIAAVKDSDGPFGQLGAALPQPGSLGRRQAGELALEVKGALQLPDRLQVLGLRGEDGFVRGDRLAHRAWSRALALRSFRAPRPGTVGLGDRGLT